jgi:multiple sugar transport system substrate-binding protein
VTPILKKLAAAALAALLPLSLAACSKGGSSSTPNASGGVSELTMWTHNAGNKNELAAITQIVDDYNASQTKYKVKIQAFPQDSYNQSVVAAAASKKLPCILDIDGPNVPNWAWAATWPAGRDGRDPVEVTADRARPVQGQDLLLRLRRGAHHGVASRSSPSRASGSPPSTPWTKDEFTAALAAEGVRHANPLDIATSFTGSGGPYAYSPFLQSFGGDLINAATTSRPRAP